MRAPRHSVDPSVAWVARAIGIAVLLMAASLVVMSLDVPAAVVGFAFGGFALLALLYGLPLLGWVSARRQYRRDTDE